MQGFKTGMWLAAGILGSIVFWFFQTLTGPSSIPQFIGQQVVAQGGYPESLTTVIGWGVHLGVSLGYSLLFAVIMLFPFSRSTGGRLLAGLVIAGLLGWVTTLLTAPAITATISVLSGKGFPVDLPGLNTALGLPFWNHELFFATVWLVYLLVPSCGKTTR